MLVFRAGWWLPVARAHAKIGLSDNCLALDSALLAPELALEGWLFYSHWVMMKEAKGQMVGILKTRWHDYAMLFGKLALEMYDKEGE